MSKKTRINRPTTATSTKPRQGVMIHQSTDYRLLPKDGVPEETLAGMAESLADNPERVHKDFEFRKAAKGTTYRYGAFSPITNS